jgi:hypothetical protein
MPGGLQGGELHKFLDELPQDILHQDKSPKKKSTSPQYDN